MYQYLWTLKNRHNKGRHSSLRIEPIRIDEYTNKKYTFLSDPDDLPIELYEK
jgi:glyoxylase I family protein